MATPECQRWFPIATARIIVTSSSTGAFVALPTLGAEAVQGCRPNGETACEPPKIRSRRLARITFSSESNVREAIEQKIRKVPCASSCLCPLLSSGSDGI